MKWYFQVPVHESLRLATQSMIVIKLLGYIPWALTLVYFDTLHWFWFWWYSIFTVPAFYRLYLFARFSSIARLRFTLFEPPMQICLYFIHSKLNSTSNPILLSGSLYSKIDLNPHRISTFPSLNRPLKSFYHTNSLVGKTTKSKLLISAELN